MNSSTLDTLPFECFWGQGEDTMFIFGCLEHEARCKKRKKKTEVEKRGKICPGLETGHKDPSFGSAGIVEKPVPSQFSRGLELSNFGDLVV